MLPLPPQGSWKAWVRKRRGREWRSPLGIPAPLDISPGRHQPSYLPILSLYGVWIKISTPSRVPVRIRNKGYKSSRGSINNVNHYNFLDQKEEKCKVPKGKSQWLVPGNLFSLFQVPQKISAKIPADTNMGWHFCVSSKPHRPNFHPLLYVYS